MKGREPYILALLVVAAGAAGAAALYHTDTSSFLYFGDAVSHLTRARQFVDSRVPGIHNIGTVWLPLPHLLYLPFSLVNALFYTGIAALLVNIPLLAAATVLLYVVSLRLNVSRTSAMLCALVFGLNPNTVYMALTPMTEIFLLFFLALAAWLLLRWMDGDGERYLLYSALAVVCASLCRYEAWLCVPFISLLAFAHVRELKRTGSSSGSLRERAHASVPIGVPVAAGVIVWAGVVLWIAWNVSEYGDALLFAHWTHSIASRTAPRAVEGHPFAAVLLSGQAIRSLFGPVLVAAAACAVVRMLRRGLEVRALTLLVLLALPGVFSLLSIYEGFAQIDQWRWNWRYLLTFSLFLSLAASLGLEELFVWVKAPAGRAAVAVGLLAIPVIQCTMPERVGVSTYIDAKKGFLDETQYAQSAGERFRQYEVSGSVALITGYSQSQRIMIASGLPLKTFRIIYSANDDEFYKPLWPGEEYVVIGKQTRPESRLLVDYWLKRRSILLQRYSVVWEDDYYLILKINPSRSSYQERDRARR